MLGSMSQLKLPVIDLSSPGLEPGKPQWTTIRDEVKRAALESYGCFEAWFEKVPVELHESMLGSLLELFDLPLHTKRRNVSSKPCHSYIGQSDMVLLYESLGIEDADVYEKVMALPLPSGPRDT